MIQFNLLPDVKLQYLKAERTKRLVMATSILVSVAALGILILLLAVTQLQKKHLNDVDRDIKSYSAKLEGQPNLSKILTVQNQLSSLTNLHNGKPAANRLFDYLGQLVPNQVNISNMTIDFNQHVITLTGSANALSTVNTFADTLKFTNYSVSGTQGTKPAFSNVVLTNFALSNNSASYTLTFNYDPTIFDITQKVTLSVPKLITTRSELDKPSDLFVQGTTSTPSAPANTNSTTGQ
ncbi:MAG TPA: hypothetical protein VFN56_00570 [Candidatus Saccharimonadales bacterium]|nr:hypothetical protein [Candidatus Saccharimonadales bacterium]